MYTDTNRLTHIPTNAPPRPPPSRRRRCACWAAGPSKSAAPTAASPLSAPSFVDCECMCVRRGECDFRLLLGCTTMHACTFVLPSKHTATTAHQTHLQIHRPLHVHVAQVLRLEQSDVPVRQGGVLVLHLMHSRCFVGCLRGTWAWPRVGQCIDCYIQHMWAQCCGRWIDAKRQVRPSLPFHIRERLCLHSSR